MQIEPGTLIGDRYRVERELGKGGMGAVYVAFDTRFDKQVAVKVTAVSGGAQEQIRGRFKREAKIGNDLGTASGIVRAFDWGEVPPSGLYLAMDLVADARPLDLTSGTLPERLQRLQAAARLVQRAHAAGVVHRDLKPANLLQDPEGGIHLTDFGIAKVLGTPDASGDAVTGGLTQSGVGMGTPFYMAPEQCADAKSVDQRCDVFALGVMLFRALTGEYPFAGSSLTEVMRKHLAVEAGTQPAPRPRDRAPEVPAQLDALCAQAIHVDPAQRLSDVGELLAGLEFALGEAPTTPEPDPDTAPTVLDEANLKTGELTPDAPTVPPTPRRRGSPWAAAVGGLLVVALNGGGYALYRHYRDLEPGEPAALDGTVPASGTRVVDPQKLPGRGGVGLLREQPVFEGRRLDQARYAGEEAQLEFSSGFRGPLKVVDELDESWALEPGQTLTLSRTLPAEPGTYAWRFWAEDADGTRSEPVVIDYEVAAPLLQARRLDQARFVGDQAQIEFSTGASAMIWVEDEFTDRWRLDPNEPMELSRTLAGEAGAHAWRFRPVEADSTTHPWIEVPYVVAPPELRLRRLDQIAPPGGETGIALSSPSPGELTVSGPGDTSWTLKPGTPLPLRVQLPQETGLYSVSFTAKDAYGNTSAPAELNVDVQPPPLPQGYFEALQRAGKLQGFDYVFTVTYACGGQAHQVAVFHHPETKLDFHLIPGGTYRPGSPPDEHLRRGNEGPCQEVTVEPFLLCTTEVTQAAWEAVMDSNPSSHTGSPGAPVETVRPEQAREFCEQLGMRLPTEEEWEYACRAGTTTPWFFGADPEAFERYGWGPSRKPVAGRPVGQKEPNAFGLRDLLTGVREWCTPGRAWPAYAGPGNVIGVSRGGASSDHPSACRSARRSVHVDDFERPDQHPPGTTQESASSEVGFRPAVSLPE